MRKLILGCGGQEIEGWIGLDRKPPPRSKANIVRDIEKGLPFDDNSVDEIIASHLLEHVNALGFVMSEIYRVLKPGAIIHIEVPLYPHPKCFQDPTHVRTFTKDTFRYYRYGEGWLQVMQDEVGDNRFIGTGFEIESQSEQSGNLIVDLKAVK